MDDEDSDDFFQDTEKSKKELKFGSLENENILSFLLPTGSVSSESKSSRSLVKIIIKDDVSNFKSSSSNSEQKENIDKEYPLNSEREDNIKEEYSSSSEIEENLEENYLSNSEKEKNLEGNYSSNSEKEENLEEEYSSDFSNEDEEKHDESSADEPNVSNLTYRGSKKSIDEINESYVEWYTIKYQKEVMKTKQKNKEIEEISKKVQESQIKKEKEIEKNKLKSKQSFEVWVNRKKFEIKEKKLRLKDASSTRRMQLQTKEQNNSAAFEDWLKKHPYRRKDLTSVALTEHFRPVTYKDTTNVFERHFLSHPPWHPP